MNWLKLKNIQKDRKKSRKTDRKNDVFVIQGTYKRTTYEMTNYTYVEKIRPNIAFRQDKHSENTNIYFVLGIYKDTDKRQTLRQADSLTATMQQTHRHKKKQTNR